MKLGSLLLILAAAIVVTFAFFNGNSQPISSRHFISLGDLGGGDCFSAPLAVSSDGTAVVGYSHSAAGSEAFRWMPVEGIVALSFPRASAVSFDGSTVIGHRITNGRVEPVRWSADGGVQALGSPAHYLNGEALGVSGNGATIIGTVETDDAGADRRDMAFRWTAVDGIKKLPIDLESIQSEAHAVSADGTVVVGTRRRKTGHDEACRWTAESGPVGLGFLPGHCSSVADAVSADGSVIVGRSSNFATYEAIRWTRETGMVSLGSLSRDGSGSAAHGVSADGSVIVGHSESESGWVAFIWDAAHGMRDIRQVLMCDPTLAGTLRRWNLRSAQAVSADGSVIVGFGLNRSGNQEAWLARIAQSPATGALIATTAEVHTVDRR